MNYVYKTHRGCIINDVTSVIEILKNSGYTIENKIINFIDPCRHFKIIKDGKMCQCRLSENYCGRPLKAGDVIWFICPDEYEEWCRGKTYAFIDDPHKIHYDGMSTASLLADHNETIINVVSSPVVDTLRYSYNDCILTADLLAYYNRTIIKVIFNDPATIVFWNDGTKTVVKCQKGDVFDKEKGLALCISKKYLGNKSNFNNEFKKWIVKEN